METYNFTNSTSGRTQFKNLSVSHYADGTPKSVHLLYSTDGVSFSGSISTISDLKLSLSNSVGQSNCNLSAQIYSEAYFLNNLTKVLLMPNADSTNNVLYMDSSTKKPSNFFEFVVCNGQYLESKIKQEALNLVEPIYITRYIYVGTHSYTNLRTINVENCSEQKKYFLIQPKTNLYDILNKLFYQCGVHSRIIIEDETLLKNSGIGMNKSYTDATLYDVLVDIGMTLGRTPKLYFNPEYAGSHVNEYLLYFEEETQNMVFTNPTNIISQISSKSMSNSQGKDAGTIICDCQNVNATESVWYPSEKGYFALTGKESDLTLSNSSDLSLKLPLKIKSVEKVMTYKFEYSNAGGAGQTQKIYQTSIEEHSCLVYDKWLSLDANSRKITFYYEEDSNEIHVSDAYNPKNGGLFSSSKTTLFRVRFTPKQNYRIVSKGDNDLQESINQSENNIDSLTYGNYLSNYAIKNDGTDYIFSGFETDFTQIKMPGYKALISSNKRVLNQTDIEFHNNYYGITYTFSSETTKRSELITADTTKDISVIDSSKACDRMDTLNANPIYVSMFKTIPTTAPSFDETGLIKNVKPLLATFRNALKDGNKFPNQAYLMTSYESCNAVITDKSVTPNTITSNMDYVAPQKYICVNIYKSIVGHTINFNLATRNNLGFEISGGLISIDGSMSQKTNSIKSICDYFGKIKGVYLYLSSDPSETESDGLDFNDISYTYDVLSDQSIDNTEPNKITDFLTAVGNKLKDYPFIDAATFNSNSYQSFIYYSNGNFYKDSNEKLNISINLPFKCLYPDSQFISEEFMRQQAILNMNTNSDKYIVSWNYDDDIPREITHYLSGTADSGYLICTFAEVNDHPNMLQVVTSNGFVGTNIAICILNTDNKFAPLIRTNLSMNCDTLYLCFSN